ncbi:VOC family protein [bacterium]|nr:VOC family protein [bacterium]
MQGNNEKLVLNQINQVGVVVNDLKKSMEYYWNTFGIGPFAIYTFEPPLVTDMMIRSKPVEYRMKIALANMGSIQLELIQPLSASIYTEFLNERGEGIHHIGCFVDNLNEAVAMVKKQGISVIQSGNFPGGGYAYLDTEKTLAAICELIQMPTETPPPEAIWPEIEATP